LRISAMACRKGDDGQRIEERPAAAGALPRGGAGPKLRISSTSPRGRRGVPPSDWAAAAPCAAAQSGHGAGRPRRPEKPDAAQDQRQERKSPGLVPRFAVAARGRRMR